MKPSLSQYLGRSPRMRMKLQDIAKGGLGLHKGERPGRIQFSSGFPTYEALERRGLVEISLVENATILWWVELTDAGWKASGVERPV